MTMDEFYARYNLNSAYFAPIAGVASRSLWKFAAGKPIRKSTEDRIRKAMRIAEKYDLVRPRPSGCNCMGSDLDWCRAVLNYEKHFKELIEAEG